MALYRLSRSIIHLTLLLLLPWRIIKYEYENSPSAWCLRGRGMALKGRGDWGRGAVCKHVQERDGNVNAHNDEPMEPSDVNALLPPLGDRPLGLHIWSSDIDRRSSLQKTRNRSRSSEKNHSGALNLVYRRDERRLTALPRIILFLALPIPHYNGSDHLHQIHGWISAFWGARKVSAGFSTAESLHSCAFNMHNEMMGLRRVFCLTAPL